LAVQRRVVIIVLLLAASLRASAFEIEYAADRPKTLGVCDGMLYAGQVAEARQCYTGLVDDDDDVRIKADASRALGELRAANTYFQTAIDQYPEDPALRTRWGELFRQTHQDDEAAKLFRESLELDAEYRPAIRGLVKVALQGFSDQANEWLDKVLDIEPDDIEAHILRARLLLEDGAVDEAEDVLGRAEQIATDGNVTPLEIYALKASVDLLRGITDSEWTERALAVNPRYGEIYATPAHFYVITRRYREAVALLRKAVEIEPTLYSAHAELGINLLRDNLVEEAQRHLALAYDGDPFSTQVVNTLRLIDSLDNFVVSSHGTDENEADEPRVLLRLHKDEAEVLEPYVLDLVRDAIDVFSKRYAFDLKEPVIVELYPEHDDFAVRTSGLPGIGLLGVTFGYLVAMDSPTGRSVGEFHWGTTLWHEMAHVFTLESTNHLVPRWFSEGISVHEEWATGPLPGRHIPTSFLEALKKDMLLPVTELDRGFIRPTYESQIIVSYMQAGLLCQFVSNTWGQPSLVAMLDAYTRGLETGDAVTAALGIAPDELDLRFRQFLDTEFGRVVANLDDWREAQQQMYEHAGDENWEAALQAAERSIDLYPDYVEAGSAYLIKAKAHEELGATDRARDTLARYFERGGYDPASLEQLAKWDKEQGDAADALAVLEAVNLVAPIEEQLHATLGDWLLEAGRNDEALQEYLALLAMDPHDAASAHYRLAQAYLALGKPAQSREHLLYALEIAPHYREAQDMLLETVR
jgi:tetratricopeptide (TPR) repeat protein